MLLLSAIPHHHHMDGATCFHIEYNHSGDHEQVGDSHGKEAENSNCVAHSLFFAHNADLGSRLKEFYEIKSDDIFFLPDLLISTSFELKAVLPVERHEFADLEFRYYTTEIPAPHGLRAPPVALA